MQADWWTFALQGVNFLVLVWLLWRFLFRPVREVIERRRQQAQEADARAAGREAAAEEARRKLEEERAQVARERQALAKEMDAELAAARDGVLDQARRQADDLLAKARRSAREERESALAAARDQVADLAADLAGRLLDEAGPQAPGDGLLDRLMGRIADLPADERERLDRDLADDGARVAVVTAAPLDAAARGRWAERLDAALGVGGRLDFETRPEILGGAELRFPHAVLGLTWADRVARARDLLREGGDHA
ncbi:MAG: hypothetical protein H6907_06225 [Hyphomicrobiales bacterium]|nr:hypothetical protein [Hyphomicrobiales bacterium]MCP5371314.1 hypothetical protein [Hyphomicrobiales bacterium]